MRWRVVWVTVLTCNRIVGRCTSVVSSRAIYSIPEYPEGTYLGYVSGYFSSDGIQFDQDSELPKGAMLPSGGGAGGSGNGGSSIQSFTGKADGDITQEIIKNGKISDDQLKKIMGGDFGKKPFKITLTDAGDNKVGQVVGSFNKNGTIIDDKKTKIPNPSAPTSAPPATSATPAPGDDNPNANHGSVSLSGSGDAIKSQLNNLSYDYISKAVGGKYGPFYITFESADRSIQGYIKGTISPNSYSYNWAYTYKS